MGLELRPTDIEGQADTMVNKYMIQGKFRNMKCNLNQFCHSDVLFWEQL